MLPALGFEYEVRVCVECNKNLTDADRVSLAVCQEAKHSILWLHLDEERGRLLTLGHDRVSSVLILGSSIVLAASKCKRFLLTSHVDYENLGCCVTSQERRLNEAFAISSGCDLLKLHQLHNPTYSTFLTANLSRIFITFIPKAVRYCIFFALTLSSNCFFFLVRFLWIINIRLNEYPFSVP